MMGWAPARAPPWMELRPIPPAPKTAIEAPAGTWAVLSTEPTPVITEQPMRATDSRGTSCRMGTAQDSGMVVYSAWLATVPKW